MSNQLEITIVTGVSSSIVHRQLSSLSNCPTLEYVKVCVLCCAPPWSTSRFVCFVVPHPGVRMSRFVYFVELHPGVCQGLCMSKFVYLSLASIIRRHIHILIINRPCGLMSCTAVYCCVEDTSVVCTRGGEDDE